MYTISSRILERVTVCNKILRLSIESSAYQIVSHIITHKYIEVVD